MFTYQVNEIFTSVQGEGVHAGRPATFIRLQGCTVGCEWCDTKYTWKKGGAKMSVDEIMTQVQAQWVVITGGEPTLYNLDPLLTVLRTNHFMTQLETSGQNQMKGIVWPYWVTWSPKPNLDFLAHSGIVHHCREIKFVIDDNMTWETIWKIYLRTLEHAAIPPAVVLMPEGYPPRSEMVQKTLDFLAKAPMDHQLAFRFGDRLHTRLNVR